MNNIYVNARFLAQNVTGVQRYAAEICKKLQKLDPAIIFLAPHDIIDHKTANQLNAIIIGKNTGTIWEQLDLPLYLKKRGSPLLLNLCNTAPLIYKNCVVTVHDMSYKTNPKWFSKSFYYWYNFLIPQLIKNARKVITVSNSSKADIIKYLNTNSDKIEVVYNSTSLKSGLQIPDEKFSPYILTVSSIDPRKNLSNLILAYQKLKQNLKLIVVGVKNKNFSEALSPEIYNDPSITFKGYVTDEELMKLYSKATVFVYPSLYEGFGLPPLEAMGMGCPVVVSDIPVLREICADSAVYIQPQSIDDIAEKINIVITNEELRNELIIKGTKNAGRFSWDLSANKILNLLNEFN